MAQNTWWNPFEKGDYGRTYRLRGDLNGRLVYRNSGLNKTFSYIFDTDYTNYIIFYSCTQAFGDFWTSEMFNIFTLDGTLSDADLTTHKATITAAYPEFPVDTIVASPVASCPKDVVWNWF